MKLKEIQIAFGAMMVREKLGGVVREIDYNPDTRMVTLHKFNATDGSMKQVYLNLNNATFWEYKIAEDNVIS